MWRIFLRPAKNLRKCVIPQGRISDVLCVLVPALRRPLNFLPAARSYGEWAVVTGCTDGIGKAFCEELAKKKFKLILIRQYIPP